MIGEVDTAYQAIQRYLILGAAIVLFVTFGIGGWAATTEISGAVVGQGVLVVESSVKKVQHPTGGTVGELRVREGDHVNAGEILVRLDETQARAAAQIVNKNLDDLRARQARLEAERDGATEITFPAELTQRVQVAKSGSLESAAFEPSMMKLRSTIVDTADSPDVDAARAMAAERRLFELRREAREGQKAQLRERIAQLRDEIKGYTGQAESKKAEIELINKELQGVRELYQKNLVPMTRLTALERDAARLEGERSNLLGVTAQAKGKITETELQIIQVDQDLRTDVGKDLAETRSKISELVERKVATEDQLKHIDIRAPQSGIVHELSVHTVGGVIGQGETIMLIVPDADTLSAEIRISPLDIDQVHLGQTASLRFSSFNQRTTPEIEGEVTLVSADLTQDQRSGASYYLVRVTPVASELPRLGGVKLVPGMPVEVFIKTGERTVLSYLVKPLRDQASRAFKER